MNEFDKAIMALVAQVAKPGLNPKPDEALKFSQAALNLAHAKAVLEGTPKPKGSGS